MSPMFGVDLDGPLVRSPPDDRVHESAWPATLNMLIERARLSRAEFCRRMGVDSGQGHRWCVDGQKPGFDTLRKMCSVLECTADELLAAGASGTRRQPITLGTLVTFEVEGEAWIGHVVAIGPAGGLGCTVRAIPVRQPTPEQVQQEVFPRVRDWGCVCTRLRVLVPGMQGAPALPGSDAIEPGDGAVQA